MWRWRLCGCALASALAVPSPSNCSVAPFSAYLYCDPNAPVDARVADLVGRLTMEEKVLQMTRGGAAQNNPAPAIPRLGIAAHVWGSECNSGLGSDDNGILGTAFPQPLGLAASFDTALVHAVGLATAVELRAQRNAEEAAGAQPACVRPARMRACARATEQAIAPLSGRANPTNQFDACFESSMRGEPLRLFFLQRL